MKAAANAKEAYGYPSRFGSHATMVDELATAKLESPEHVVCRDEYGQYTTESRRLDDGLADPNRYCVERLTKLFGEQDAAL
jgi:hypothetical protein